MGLDSGKAPGRLQDVPPDPRVAACSSKATRLFLSLGVEIESPGRPQAMSQVSLWLEQPEPQAHFRAGLWGREDAVL